MSEEDKALAAAAEAFKDPTVQRTTVEVHGHGDRDGEITTSIKRTRKLDIACGASKAEGFEGCDIAALPGVDHVLDIMHFPWPFADETFDELRCSHYVEHIPQAFFTPNPKFPIGPNITAIAEGPHSVSLFIKFFEEAHRVLKKGGSIHVICPMASSDRCWQDPTHTRAIVQASWDYLDKAWRQGGRLEHAAYDSTCDFPIALRKTNAVGNEYQMKVLSLMADTVQDAAVNRYRNMLSDWDVTLTKAPVLAPVAESSLVSSSIEKPKCEGTTNGVCPACNVKHGVAQEVTA